MTGSEGKLDSLSTQGQFRNEQTEVERKTYITRRDPSETTRPAMLSEIALSTIPTERPWKASKSVQIGQIGQKGTTRSLSVRLTGCCREIESVESDRSTTTHGMIGLVRCKKRDRCLVQPSRARGRGSEIRTNRAVCLDKENGNRGQVQTFQRRSTEFRSDQDIQISFSRWRCFCPVEVKLG